MTAAGKRSPGIVGQCVGVYSVRLWHTLRLPPVLHRARFPTLLKDDPFHGKGQK